MTGAGRVLRRHQIGSQRSLVRFQEGSVRRAATRSGQVLGGRGTVQTPVEIVGPRVRRRVQSRGRQASAEGRNQPAGGRGVEGRGGRVRRTVAFLAGHVGQGPDPRFGCDGVRQLGRRTRRSRGQKGRMRWSLVDFGTVRAAVWPGLAPLARCVGCQARMRRTISVLAGRSAGIFGI